MEVLISFGRWPYFSWAGKSDFRQPGESHVVYPSLSSVARRMRYRRRPSVLKNRGKQGPLDEVGAT